MPTLAAGQSSCASASLNSLDQAIQHELRVLATLEADHCSACRWLDEWCAPEAVKEQVASRLETRHRTKREAHVLRLAELHHQKRMLRAMSETSKYTNEVTGSGAGLTQSKLPRLLPPAWMVASPDQGQAGSTITARPATRTGNKARRVV